MELYLRGKTWWCRFTFDGKQQRHSTKTKKANKTKAQSVAADLLRKLERGESLDEKVAIPPTLKEFAEGWFREWITSSRRLKERSKESYAYGVSLLSKQDLYLKRMDTISAEDADMMKIEGSAATFNCAVRTLRRMFRLAVGQGKIAKYPQLRTLDESRRTELIEPSEEREIATILSSKRIGREHGSIRSAFPLHQEMGMLPFEIAGLRVEDVDFSTGRVRISRAGRYVTMTENARAALAKQCRGKSDWVFPSSNMPGKPITRQAVTKALTRIKRGRPTSSALQVAWPIHIDTGLRPHEMVHLRVEFIDLTRGHIDVKTSKTKAGERRIPMSDRVKRILFEQVAGRTEGWLFPSPRYPEKPITRAALTKAFANARTLAGISKSKKLYTARHTFATDMMAATRDPKLVMELAGHSDLKTTMTYLHPETSRAVEILNDRNRDRASEVDGPKPVN
jgi:integrase